MSNPQVTHYYSDEIQSVIDDVQRAKKLAARGPTRGRVQLTHPLVKKLLGILAQAKHTEVGHEPTEYEIIGATTRCN